MVIFAVVVDAAERDGVASARRAVAVEEALLADCAGWAGAAAIDVGAWRGPAGAVFGAVFVDGAICALQALHALAAAVAHHAAHVVMARHPGIVRLAAGHAE